MGMWLLALGGAGFWGGILLAGLSAEGHGLGAGRALLAVGLAGLGAVGATARRARRTWAVWTGIPVAFLALGAGWGAVHDARIRASPPARLAGRSVEVWATLQSDPEPGGFGWSADARTEVLFPGTAGWPEALRVSALILVESDGEVPPLGVGDRIAASGYLDAPSGRFGSFLRRRGYAAALSSRDVRFRAPPASPLLRAARAVRGTLQRSLRATLPDREAALVMGLALGDTSRLDPAVVDEFRATGLSHLVAVSGANVAMFLAPILGLVGLFGLGLRWRFGVGVGSVAFFVLLTGAEPSVLRASVMTGFALLAVLLGRPRSPPAILGGSVLALLAMDPTLAYAIGFQLSVAATVGMVLLSGPLARGLRFLPGPMALAAAATLGAQAAVTPVLLFHFGVVPTVTLPANLIAFPAVSPAMMLGLGAGAAGLVWEPLGRTLGLAAMVPLRYLEVVAERLARSPLPSITSPGGQLGALVLGLAAVAALGWWLHSGRRPSRRALVALGVALPVFVWSGAVRAGPPTALTAVFFDVGQGDAALVRSPAGATVLIDGGPDPYIAAGKLAALGVRRIDLLVATHSHADHVVGLPAVLRRFAVSLAVDPGCGEDSPFYADFVEAVRRAGVPFRHPREGQTLIVGDLRLEVLGPATCFRGTESDPNNDSLVLRMVYGGVSILFTGDAEKPAQQQLLEHESARLVADVLKVPHHGGATSLDEFLADVHAVVAVVSVGQPNRYGHPVPEVLQQLTRDGMRVFRTDRAGDITIRLPGDDGGGPLIQSSGG
jgi:competence protein ComEC